MKTLIDEIKLEIKSHNSISNSALKKFSDWKRIHYIQLSEIISKEISQSKYLQGDRKFELGNSISYITLQRLFEDSYNNTAFTDLRFLKTLHKLSIFLGYFDLNDYIISSKNIKIDTKNDNSKVIYNVVENLFNAKKEIIKSIPSIDISKLDPYVFKDSSTYERLKGFPEKYQKANYYFDHDYKDHIIELVSCELIADNDENIKIIRTQEHWDFILKDNENKTCYFKVFNWQTYYLKKDEDGQWKVWENYDSILKRLKSFYT